MSGRRLPTFEEIRVRAYGLLGDAEDVLRSDWRPDAGPSRAQALAMHAARKHIAAAKTALNRAAGGGGR